MAAHHSMATTGMQGGFATASGKTVSVSAAALQRARVLWDEANRDEPEPFCGDEGRDIGFATGSGKKVDVSAGALERAEGLWGEVEKLSPSEECLFDEETNEDMSKCDAVVTGSLEDAILEDKYLEEEFAKDLTPDEEDVPFCGLSEGIPGVSMVTAGFGGGFSTASGKSVSVSAAALERAQGLWKEECDKDSTITDINSSPEGLPEDIGAKTKPVGFSAGAGFSTASGKSVKVSAAALEKAKQLWKEDSEKEAGLEGLEDYDFPESPPEDNSIPPKNVPGSSFSGGFATASGKGVSVSAAAMERAQGLWREESEKEEEQEEESLDRSEACDIRREDKEVLRKEAPGPSFTSTPVALSSSMNKGEKPRGFITPFRKHTNVLTPLQQKVSPLVVGSTNNPPAPNLSRSVPIRKTLGARLNSRQSTPSTSTLLRESQSLREPLKRGRCPSDESHPLNKTPKISNSLMSTSSTSSHSLASTCTTLDSNTSLNSSKASYSISESQEILESSKALLEDCDQEMMMEGPDCTSGNLPDGPVAFHLFLHDGKPVSHILAMVLRVYPLTFACKSLDKKIDFYSEASYEKLKVMRERKEQEEMERIYSQVEAEMKKTKQQQTRRLPLSCLNKDNLERMPVEELLGIAAGGDDFCDIQFLLSSSKLLQLQEAREKERETTTRAIKVEVEKRLKTLTFGFSSITPVLKIRLMDMTHASSSASRRFAVLSFWGPSEDLCTSFVEGSVYDISSISSSHSRPDELRLNSMRGTQVQVRTHPLAAEQFQLFARKCFTVGEVVDDEFSPAFNEFDLVGLVVSVDDANNSGGSGQVVYLADEAVNIMGLKLWKSVRDEGLEKFLTVGNFVGVSNVQWRQSSRNHSIPWGFVQETTKFCSRPKESRIGTCLEHLRSSITDVADYVSECEGKIQAVLSGSSVETPKTPPLVRRIQRHNTEDLPHKRLEFRDD